MISTSLSLSSLQKDTKGYKKLASTNSQRTNLIFYPFFWIFPWSKRFNNFTHPRCLLCSFPPLIQLSIFFYQNVDGILENEKKDKLGGKTAIKFNLTLLWLVGVFSYWIGSVLGRKIIQSNLFGFVICSSNKFDFIINYNLTRSNFVRFGLDWI